MPDKKKKIRGNDPRLNEPKRRGDSRALELPSGLWQWNTDGRDVTIYAPDNARHRITVGTVLGMSAEEWQSCMNMYREDRSISVEPNDVKKYIEENLLNT